jgi:CheY-like chemotaxis protein
VARVRLLHWHADEAEERAEGLRALGHEVEATPPFEPEAVKALREHPPDAFLVDLSRLPSHGREVAVLLRQGKRTRTVPLLFVGGAPDKVARVQAVLPDAVYTTWERVAEDLSSTLANPPEVRIVPGSIMDAYAGTPLPQKLGVKAGSVLDLVDAPEHFEGTLGELPEGTTVSRQQGGGAAVTLWFVRERRELERRFVAIAAAAEPGWLWVAWPKKGSGVPSDLDQQAVRDVGLAAGWVDSKVGRIDATWAALRFSRRRSR